MSTAFTTRDIHAVTAGSIEDRRRLKALRDILADSDHPLHLQVVACADLAIAVDLHDGEGGSR